jgi:hypothetical protein
VLGFVGGVAIFPTILYFAFLRHGSFPRQHGRADIRSKSNDKHDDKPVQVSVLTIDTDLALLFCMQQVRDMGPTAHVQSSGYPF